MHSCYIDNDISLPLSATCIVNSVKDVFVIKIIKFSFFYHYRVIATVINITLIDRIKYEYK
jgi:hypothetical protein